MTARTMVKDADAALRRQRGEGAHQALEEQPAEEQFLHGRGEHDGGDGDHHEAAAVGAPGQAGGRPVEVVDVVLERART